jgi:hypothetical protein
LITWVMTKILKGLDMIINPYILQKIRPYINPHITNPCIQKHSNNENM